MTCLTSFVRLRRAWAVWLITVLLIMAKTQAGVPGLSKNFRDNYKLAWRGFGSHKGIVKSISQAKPLVVDHLCIDLNQIIHSCVRGSYKAPTISARMFAKLDSLLAEAPPKKSLVFAIDGAAPYAKVQTQRQRRKIDTDISMITPGTEFMNSMESVLLCYVLQRSRRFNLQDVAVFISDSTCPGEGELKIIDWIRRHMPAAGALDIESGMQENTLTTDTVAICGSDADILIQGLGQQARCPNIHVIQAGMDSTDSVCNITALLENIFACPTIRTRPNSTASPSIKHKFEKRSFKLTNASQIPLSVRSDLVVRFSLAGNDYLPRLRGVPLLPDLHSEYMKELPPEQRHIINHANKTFNFVALWALMREADAATSELLPLPVTIPSVTDALGEVERLMHTSKMKSIKNAASSTAQLAEWNWTTTLLPANTVIRSYVHPETGRTQYFLPPPANHTLCANRTIYHLNESLAYTGEHNMSVFKNNLAWVCSLEHQGHCYTSLRLRPIKPSARRHLADQVLQDWRQDAHEALKAKRNTSLELLERMRVMAAEETEARRRTLGLNNSVRIPALEEDHRATTSAAKRVAPGSAETSDNMDNVDDFADLSDDSNESLVNTGTVSRHNYLQYLRDSDIEHYLRGLLWVEYMYTQGRCSDLGYTFNALPPISALAIQAYIERRALEHWYMQQPDYPHLATSVPPMADLIRSQQAALARDVVLPESAARSLTADAAAVCVTPKEGVVYLPLSLRKSWKEIDDEFSAQVTHNNSEIFCKTYDDVVASIDKSFAAHRQGGAPPSRTNLTENDTVIKPKDIWASGTKSEQQRRASANSFGTLSSAQMPVVHNTWTVLATRKLLRKWGYRGQYKHKALELPLPITFATYNLGAGASLFRLENHDDSSHSQHEPLSISDGAEINQPRIRSWKPSKRLNLTQTNEVHTKTALNQQADVSVRAQEMKIDREGIIHQDMLARPSRSTLNATVKGAPNTRSAHNNDHDGHARKAVGFGAQQEGGIIHQEMLTKHSPLIKGPSVHTISKSVRRNGYHAQKTQELLEEDGFIHQDMVSRRPPLGAHVIAKRSFGSSTADQSYTQEYPDAASARETEGKFQDEGIIHQNMVTNKPAQRGTWAGPKSASQRRNPGTGAAAPATSTDGAAASAASTRDSGVVMSNGREQRAVAEEHVEVMKEEDIIRQHMVDPRIILPLHPSRL